MAGAGEWPALKGGVPREGQQSHGVSGQLGLGRATGETVCIRNV
jgi:hypothetical protein